MVELRQQPSSQGEQAAWGRPGAAPQLVPLLSFTVEFMFATVFRPYQNISGQFTVVTKTVKEVATNYSRLFRQAVMEP
jgi:hypothetical protein